jgi:AraC-like DNA-binding protein
MVVLKSSSHNPPALVPISEAYSFSEGAVLRGLSRDELFKLSFLDSNPTAPISTSQIVLLAMNAMVETDDPFSGYGLRPYPLSQLVLMFRIMMACETLQRAIGSIATFHTMSLPISIRLRMNAEEAQLCIRCDEEFGGDNAAIIEDVYLNSIFGGLSYFLGRRFPVTAVVTRNRGHTLGTRHWSILAPIHIGGGAALYFPAALLKESRQGNPTDDIFWSILEHRLALDNGPGNLVPDQSVSIRRLNTIALCDELGISPATFRRRNSAAGGGFRRFREETLVEASLSLLVGGSRSISSIAADLGYADVRSYRRFIKGATGMTPDRLRAVSVASIMQASEPEIVSRIREIAIRLSH